MGVLSLDRSSSLKSKTVNTVVVNLDDIENEAKKKLPKSAFDYYRSGATNELTLGENELAFQRILIRPRVLANDVSQRSTSTTVQGISISFPVCVAPTAMQKMANEMGEIANALACQSEQTIMTLSTISTTSMEDVARSTPNSPKFFQLYIYKNRDLTRQLVGRAEQAGYRALVLTVDTPFMGQRYADERNRFTLPANLRMANFPKDLEESNRIQRLQNDDSDDKPTSGLTEYTSELFDQSLTWNDVRWLKSITRLPIITKGIMTPEDALIALEHNVDGIWVSNHGGRQLDTVPATIDVLPDIVNVVRGRCEVYLDGGIRRGTDIFKAIALGARAVFIGRPMVYGLAFNGMDGGRRVLQILRNEFDKTMALSGCSRLEHINQSMIITRKKLLAKL
ncbi:hydroxyacid oxidase [Dermatophagoides pteronyssinus]|uniref:hydroxyacid oxidase n=1 Tax=Dermatophagoides pteronyssinus TaxID=6956 RepID=UPI003F6799AF